MENVDAFINSFQQIEEYLIQKTNSDRYSTFTSMITECSDFDPVIRKYQNELKLFGNLRNAIIHKKVEWSPIANPNEQAVEFIGEIVVKLLKPVKVIPAFKRDVATCSLSDSIANVLTEMYKNDFSQVPVLNEGKCVNLLTTNSISRWLSENVKNELVDLEETTVEQVLQFKEEEESFAFISRNATLAEAYSYFEKNEKRRAALDALLITENGKPHQGLLGMITHYDLPDIVAKI